jgi:hypothetical protein
VTAPQRPASPARTVFSALLWIAAGLLAVLFILVLVGAATSHTSSGSAYGGAGFLILLACLTGSWAHAVARGGRATTTAIGPNSVGADSAPPLDSRAAGRMDAGQHRRAALPAASARVSFREHSSQFPVLGALICGALAIGSVAGLVTRGSGNNAGSSALLFGALIGVGYLLFALADLANGVQIRAGRFVIGAMGVPPAGRIWRRVCGPLDSVQSWELLNRDQVRRLDAARRAEARSGRRRIYLGDLRFLGRRQVLRLIIDPAAAEASFPSHVQEGYGFKPAARAGAVWDGAVLIGTRHPAALTAALEQALPGRHVDTRLPPKDRIAAPSTRQ